MRNGEYKMIPKIIHYCWLSGDEFNKKMCRILESKIARL